MAKLKIILKIVVVLMAIFLAVSFIAKFVFNHKVEKEVEELANTYISKQEVSIEYKLEEVEYSSTQNCYFAYFENKNDPNSET